MSVMYGLPESLARETLQSARDYPLGRSQIQAGIGMCSPSAASPPRFIPGLRVVLYFDEVYRHEYYLMAST